MARGGYQRPSKPAGASAPGAGSRRTDGRVQPIREPDIDDPSLQYGDRKNLGEAQRIAKLANAGGQRRLTGQPGEGPRSRKLPPWIFEGDSTRPGEPGSTGLAMGPGLGPEALMAQAPSPDVREVVLTYLRDMYQNEEANQALSKLFEERAGSFAAGPMTPEQMAAPTSPSLPDPMAEEDTAEMPVGPE